MLGATMVQGWGTMSPGSSSLCASGCFTKSGTATFPGCPGDSGCTHVGRGPALRPRALRHLACGSQVSPSVRKQLCPQRESDGPELPSKLQWLSVAEWDIP